MSPAAKAKPTAASPETPARIMPDLQRFPVSRMKIDRRYRLCHIRRGNHGNGEILTND
jgi:hypothetical protein